MTNAPRRRVGPSDRRLRWRLVLGAVSLGGQHLAIQLRSWNRELHGAGTLPPPHPRHRVRHRLVGALVDASTRAAPAGRSLRTLHRRSVAVGVPAADRSARWFLHPARGLRRRAERLKDRIQSRLSQWEAIGRREEAEARALTRIGFQHTTARVLEWVSRQPALRQMVAEQSVGLTRTVLDDIRNRARGADARAESWIRRLLRRHPRPAPTPVPATAE